MKLTNKQIMVLKLLHEHPYLWHSPSHIGIRLKGRSYIGVSAWASPICQHLVRNGLAIRWTDGTYKITMSGINVVHEWGNNAKCNEGVECS